MNPILHNSYFFFMFFIRKPITFKLITKTAREKMRKRSFWIKEPETIEWIKSFDPQDVFFDVGANIGVYSLYAASLYSEMNILAFEPVLGNYKRLLDNIILNNFRNIIALPFAVSDKNKIGEMFINDLEIGSSGSQLDSAENIFKEAFTPVCSYKVLALSVKNFVQIFTKITPNHIKIDIDGQEMKVIAGIDLSDKNLKSFLVEINRNRTNIKYLNNLTEKHNFTKENRFNKLENNSRKNRQDNSENIIYTRVVN